METNIIHTGDAFDVLPELDDESVVRDDEQAGIEMW